MFRRHRHAKDFSDEVEAHLALEADRLRREGLSDTQADAAAHRAFGNVTAANERFYEASRWLWLDHLARDLRYAARSLRRSPGFTLTAVLVLGLGLGANTAIFSVIDAVLLRSLPYPEPERLVLLFERDVLGNGGGANVVSLANVLDWQEQSASFDFMAVARAAPFNLSGGGESALAPERIQGAICSWSLFATLGEQPLLGRTFTREEDKPGATQVVVISYGLWQRRFGGAPDILQRTIRLNGENYQIAGVMPRGFAYPYPGIQVWAPVQRWLEEAEIHSRPSHQFYAVARLRRHVTLEQARAELDGIARRIWMAHPGELIGRGAAVFPLREFVQQRTRTSLWVLFAAVGCVLLIACVNIANLLLARASKRRRELAVRAAIGAGRGRLVRQLLTESFLLSVLGAGFGLLFAALLTGVLSARAPALLNRGDIDNSGVIRLDLTVFLFAGGLALLVGLVTGLIPAFQSSCIDLVANLKEGARSATTGRREKRFHHVLLATEVGLSLVLLISAALLLRSFDQLRRVLPGVRTDHLLTAGLALDARYNNRERVASFDRQLLDRLRAIPGVQSADLVSCLPAGGYCGDEMFFVEGQPLPQGQFRLALNRAASPGYFTTAVIPLLRGRAFTADDRRAILISESMAKKFWPGEEPMGKRIYFDDGQLAPRYEVIGIVGDVRISLDDRLRPTMYRPIFEGTRTTFYAVLRTALSPASLAPAVRREIGGLDPDLPIFAVRTMEEVLDASSSHHRFQVLLVGAFALLALVLAAVGLYGVLSYTVSQRTGEIGIRMALGAGRAQVRRLVIVQGVRPALAGMTVGWLGALAAARVLRGLLFGVGPHDVLTFAAAPLLLLLVVLAACYIPAVRATRVDPAVALHSE